MKRHKHSLSHYRLLSCDMGTLVPVSCVEVLPGDTIQHQTSALLRVSPLVAPLMHPVQVRIHHWFVPNRLVWPEWEIFITGAESGWTYPTVTVPASAEGTLLDYMGVPPVANEVVSALPVRAYNKIYNEFYRDQDLVTEAGEDDLNLHTVAWEKDYFTSARPWPQKGTAVTIPLGENAPVELVPSSENTNSMQYRVHDTDALASGGIDVVTKATGTVGHLSNSVDSELYTIDPNGRLRADLTNVVGASITDFREAFALQRFQEARARYGSRYTEYLRYLGIRPSDARLQRPEYLGGGRQTFGFSEVLQTAPDGGTNTVVGELRGHGIAALRARRYRRFFEEHGHVVSLMSVRPKAMYNDALHKKWLRREHTDYFQKELEAIGQQEIARREIFAEAGSGGDTVFGYTDRYREYREEPSLVHSEFRSTLDFWHLARKLGSAPTLNQSFIECVPSKRIHAVQTNDVLWCMINHSIQARRLVNRRAQASLR